MAAIASCSKPLNYFAWTKSEWKLGWTSKRSGFIQRPLTVMFQPELYNGFEPDAVAAFFNKIGKFDIHPHWAKIPSHLLFLLEKHQFTNSEETEVQKIKNSLSYKLFQSYNLLVHFIYLNMLKKLFAKKNNLNIGPRSSSTFLEAVILL